MKRLISPPSAWVLGLLFSTPLLLFDAYRWALAPAWFLGRGDTMIGFVGLAISDRVGDPVRVFHAPWYGLTRLNSFLLQHIGWDALSIYPNFIQAGHGVNVIIILAAGIWIGWLLRALHHSPFGALLVGSSVLSMPAVAGFSGALSGYYQIALLSVGVVLSAVAFYQGKINGSAQLPGWFTVGILASLHFGALILYGFLFATILLTFLRNSPTPGPRSGTRRKRLFVLLILPVLIGLFSKLFHSGLEPAGRAFSEIVVFQILIAGILYCLRRDLTIYLSSLTAALLGWYIGVGDYGDYWGTSLISALVGKGGSRGGPSVNFDVLIHLMMTSVWFQTLGAVTIFGLAAWSTHKTRDWRSGVRFQLEDFDLIPVVLFLLIVPTALATRDLHVPVETIREDGILFARYFWTWAPLPALLISLVRIPAHRRSLLNPVLLALFGIALYPVAIDSWKSAAELRARSVLIGNWADRFPASTILCRVDAGPECSSLLSLNNYRGTQKGPTVQGRWKFVRTDPEARVEIEHLDPKKLPLLYITEFSNPPPELPGRKGAVMGACPDRRCREFMAVEYRAF